jgi:hypothetical protein
MALTTLAAIAIARSGDKGKGSNIGVMAKTPALYEFLRNTLTSDVVKDYFREICHGPVTSFILEDSLGGGGTETLITDAQGKVHGLGLLHLPLDVPDQLLAEASHG